MTFTVILHCRDCKHTWRIQLNAPAEIYQQDLHCPACRSTDHSVHWIKGTKSSTRCTAACHQARDKSCRCSCGGANHGIAHDTPTAALIAS